VFGTTGEGTGGIVPADRRAGGGIRPQPSVGQDLLDHLRLVNERADAHEPPTPQAQQGIDRIDLSNVMSPPLLEAARAGRWGHLDEYVWSLASPPVPASSSASLG